MPTKQEMLAKIYEVIADKTLSFGCKVQSTRKSSSGNKVSIVANVRYKTIQLVRYDTYLPIARYIIIGHPVMIGDVLDWYDFDTTEYDYCPKCGKKVDLLPHHYESGGDTHEDTRPNCENCGFVDYVSTSMEIIHDMRKNKRLPIDQQSEECIKYVYNLLPPT